MELGVDRIGADPSRMEAAPQLAEVLVVGATTQRARTMTGGERRHLVEKEELREPTGLHEGRAVPAAEFEAARDPAPAGEAPADPALLVVEAPAVPVHQPSALVCDQVSERRDAVLQRHLRLNVATSI